MRVVADNWMVLYKLAYFKLMIITACHVYKHMGIDNDCQVK